MGHSARGFTAHLAKPLERHIKLRLVFKKTQSHGIEGGVVRRVHLHESHYFVFDH